MKTVIKPSDITRVGEKGSRNGFMETLGKHEYELIITIMIKKCQETNEWKPVKTVYEHPEMVEEGWLQKTGECTYIPTNKAIATVYARFPAHKQ